MKSPNSIRQNTIVYGGAFNPPTIAHEQILRRTVEFAERNHADIWLLPSGSRRDKDIDTTDTRRIELLQALVRDVASRTVKVIINTDELQRDEHTETIDTVRAFDERYPRRDFRWVFGSDSYGTMETWNDGVWMKENLHMLIIERPGYPVGDSGSNVAILAVPELDVSSTEVRRRMNCGEDYSELVGASVLRLLTK